MAARRSSSVCRMFYKRKAILTSSIYMIAMEATFWNVGPRLYRFEAHSVGQNM